MKKARINELNEIATKVMSKPEVLDKLNSEIDRLFSDLGFILTPEEKAHIMRKLLTEQKKAKTFLVCAGDGARCCRQK